MVESSRNPLTDGGSSGRLEVPSQEKRWALEYLVVSADEAALKKRREKLRDDIKSWILDNCEPDENGNFTYYFDEPVILDNDELKGLQAQRRVSEFVNEETAFEVAEKYNVLDQVLEVITTEELDMDKMYQLNQLGTISDEDIDSILELKETYALVRI